MIDLWQLPYPRHLHHADGASMIVHRPDACQAACDQGWQLLPVGAEYPVAGAVEIVEPLATLPPPEPVAPKKGKR